MYRSGLPAPPPAVDPAPRTAARLPATALLAALALVASLVTAIKVWTDDDSATGLFGDLPGKLGDQASDGKSGYEGWDERVVDLVAFVESERGLEFREPVEIDFMTADDFVQELEVSDDDLSDEELEAFQDTLPMMRALGLVAGELDLLDDMEEYSQTATLAFYDSERERIAVPTTEPTVVDDATLVHELTHALQDQHFDLDTLIEQAEDPAGSGDDAPDSQAVEPTLELLALVEGDASRVETAYIGTLSSDELEEYTDSYNQTVADAQDVLQEIPSALIATMESPYVLGEPLVATIAADGGNEAVDRAFESSPPNAKHLVDPRTYLDQEDGAVEPASDLEAPPLPAGVADPLDEGEFSALDVFFVLAERIEPLEALAAADSWQDGSYVVYEQDGRTCYRILLRGDETGTMRTTFDQWVQGAPPAAGAVILAGEGFDQLVQSCDPGPDAELPHDRALEVLALVSLRSSTAWELTEHLGLGTAEAWDAAECFAAELYDRGALIVDASQPPDPSQQADMFMEIRRDCGF